MTQSVPSSVSRGMTQHVNMTPRATRGRPASAMAVTADRRVTCLTCPCSSKDSMGKTLATAKRMSPPRHRARFRSIGAPLKW